MRLKSRVARLEKMVKALRCASCAYTLADVAPPLPGVVPADPAAAGPFVIACCWKCGARFTITGGSLRERQLRALYFSTDPAKAYTDRRAAALTAYVLRRHLLEAARAEEAAPAQEAEPDYYHGRRPKKREQPGLSAAARRLRALLSRLQFEGAEFHERMRRLHGEQDFASITFAEIETLFFGEASAEALALDAEYTRLLGDEESGESEKV